MSTYLVTGAAGFIGAKVCEFLLKGGHTVVGADNLNDYYDVRLKDYRLGQLVGDQAWRTNADPKRSVYARALQCGAFMFRPIDVEDLAGLEQLFTEFRFDAVFNLSGRAGVRYSMVNPHVYMYADVMDENGKAIPYSFETGPPGNLRRSGVVRTMFNVGDVVTIDAAMAKDGTKHLGLLKAIHFADGHTVVFGSAAESEGKN